MSDLPIYEPGDVVYGADPFKGADAARPWLVVTNHKGQPFHGEQYVALTLTTKTWHDGFIELEPEDWVEGGAPERSHVVPWGVQSIDREDVEFWQGRLADDLVHEAVSSLVECLQLPE